MTRFDQLQNANEPVGPLGREEGLEAGRVCEERCVLARAATSLPK